MATWELLRGIHNDKSAKLVSRCSIKDQRAITEEKIVDQQPTRVLVTPENGTYMPGDRFSTPKDMSRHNDPSNTRFQKVDDMAEPVEETLQGMTIQELRVHAESNGIELGDNTRKDDIISVIEAALVA